MIYTSLAVLALSASAAVSPFSSLIHLHPHRAQADSRVEVTVLNSAHAPVDLQVGDRMYTVQPQHVLNIKAPAGTMVYAASRFTTHKRGDAVLEIQPAMNNRVMKLD